MTWKQYKPDKFFNKYCNRWWQKKINDIYCNLNEYTPLLSEAWQLDKNRYELFLQIHNKENFTGKYAINIEVFTVYAKRPPFKKFERIAEEVIDRLTRRKKMKHYSHGEVNIFQIKKLPEGLKKVKVDNDKYIVADSETVGNYHCIEKKESVEMYEKDGVLYMVNTEPTNVFCVNEGRHDSITLEPSVWEIDKAKEFDYLTMETRNVAD